MRRRPTSLPQGRNEKYRWIVIAEMSRQLRYISAQIAKIPKDRGTRTIRKRIVIRLTRIADLFHTIAKEVSKRNRRKMLGVERRIVDLIERLIDYDPKAIWCMGKLPRIAQDLRALASNVGAISARERKSLGP